MRQEGFVRELKASFRGRVKTQEPLARHTTLGIGGPACFFIEPSDEADLKVLLKALKRGKIPFLLIGSGSNILASDKGVEAAVVALSAPSFRKIGVRADVLEAGAGATLASVVSAAARAGLTGAEFLCGIPGTVGGALVMNAGVSGVSCAGKAEEISGLVQSIRVMDSSGKVKTLRPKEARFAYRSSALGKFIVLSVRLRMRRGRKERILREIRQRLQYRRKTHGWAARSAGCVFKNPAGVSAGRLIDSCGLKGRRAGGACISERHANFILNRGRAKAEDVLRLMREAAGKVKRRFGVNLEPEIKIWHRRSTAG